ncbi:NACHT domain-containing protein [Calothrix sp. CCY 0018]|uniref:NACHT domain-containing protein n=1 Tax=Calothrix sp. CCY 0018 TaxID=3103864 RepID=UPI0039C75336
MDLLVVWGVAQAAGFIFKPILSELSKDLGNIAKDAAKDWTKDLFKGIPGNALKRLQKQDIDVAAGKALKEFLLLVQQELEDADIEDEELQQFVKPFNKFIYNKDVKEILGSAFNYECEILNTKKLESKWYELDLPALPDEFDWKKLGKRYLKKVKAIIRDSDKLRVILDSQNLEAIKDNTQETAGIIPDFDLLGYQEAIKETYGKLKLESLDTTGYAYNELKLWGMFIAQNVREVNENLPQHELPKEHLKRLQESQQEPIRSVLEVINDKQTYNYTVILGDPGCGKSTLLQYLALTWAESPLNNSISQPIPLLIELRTYMRRRDDKECSNFIEFFHKCSGAVHHLNQHQLQTQLKAGNVLVMFDGLDEVFDAGKREDVITDIHRFTNEYPDVQVIVTSRVIDYKYKSQRLRDAEFKHFMIQDLETEQIQDFIYRWHELTFNDEADKVRKKERLQKGIENSKAIRELAGNPLLLTMMAILNRNQELPRDRAELYNQASRVLLHQWDVERTLIEDKLDPIEIDYKDKQAMLRQVAYFMQTSDQGLAGNLIKESDLERILKEYLKTIEVDKPRVAAKLIINQLRTRNFMLCYLGADYYGFIHRTFLEYFCAWEFVWQFKETQTLSIEQLKTEVFGKNWGDKDWYEVLTLIAGMIDARFVGEIIEFLIEQNGIGDDFINIYVANECFKQVKNPSNLNSIVHLLFKFIFKSINYIIQEYSMIEVNFERICIKVISWITTDFKTHPETLPLLKKLIDSTTVEINRLNDLPDDDGYPYNHDDYLDDDDVVRIDQIETIQKVALQELVKGWKDDPDTLPMLKNLIFDDANNHLRAIALQELVKGWKDDPNTLPMLKNLVFDDANNHLRAIALQELVKGWKDDLDTLPMLKNLLLSNNKDVDKSVVIKELASNWKDEPDILSVLIECCQLENDYLIKDSLRETLMQELIQSWQPTLDIYDFIYDIAADNSFNDLFTSISNPNCNPRQTALEAILENYPNHAKTLPLLRDRAENDPDEQLREFAWNKLEKW